MRTPDMDRGPKTDVFLRMNMTFSARDRRLVARYYGMSDELASREWMKTFIEAVVRGKLAEVEYELGLAE